jgi:hypothetical protein
MLLLPEFLISGLKLFQSRVVEGKKDFLVISNRQLGSIHNKSAPDYLCDLMPLPVGSVSQYNLRNSNNYVLPNCRIQITKKSFFPSTTRHIYILSSCMLRTPLSEGIVLGNIPWCIIFILLFYSGGRRAHKMAWIHLNSYMYGNIDV